MIEIAKYPDEIEFHLPPNDAPVALKWGDDVALFRQLVCWCIIQRYRYYVLSDPAVSDTEYDEVEKFVLDMREEAEYLKRMYCPLAWIGSSRPEDYPSFVRCAFGNPSCPGNA